MKPKTTTLGALFAVVNLVLSCGVPSENVTVRQSDASPAGTSGTGGTAADGGQGIGTGATGTGGASSGGTSGDSGSPGGCEPACEGDTPFCVGGVCAACLDDEAQCSGNTPELCVDGAWVPQTTCSGATAACSNGTCASLRLSGGLVTEATPAPAATLRLREHGLTLAPRTCGASVCVTGGILP